MDINKIIQYCEEMKSYGINVSIAAVLLCVTEYYMDKEKGDLILLKN